MFKLPRHRTNHFAVQSLLACSLLLSACQTSPTHSPGVQSAATASPALPSPTLIAPSTASASAPAVLASPSPGSSASSLPNPTPSASPESLLPGSLASLTIVADRVTFFEIGQQTQLSVKLLDATGQAISASVPLNWLSSNPQQFSVDAQGLLTALQANGSSEITVSIPGTDFKASLRVSFAKSTGSGGGGGSPGGSSNTESIATAVRFQGLGRDEFNINTYTINDQQAAKVAMDSQGNFVVVWVSNLQDGSFRGIYAQRFDHQALPLGAEFRVNTITTGDQYEPVIAMNENGDFVVAWTSFDQNSAEIHAQRYTADGQTLGAEFQANLTTAGSQYNPTIGIDASGQFVIAYTTENLDGDNTAIEAVRYDASGQFIEGFQVNSNTAGVQALPQLAMNGPGQFVIAWRSDSIDGDELGVAAQRYDSNGDPEGEEFQVNTYTAGAQTSPAIALNDQGRFVITWDSSEQDGSLYGIYAQRYDANGEPAGAEFQVNTYSSSSQSNPAVAIDSSGNFVAAWESNGQDGSSYGIYAQRYSSTGLALGAEFQLNTSTENSQDSPAVAINNEGQFVGVWQRAAGSSNDIVGKYFNAQGISL